MNIRLNTPLKAGGEIIPAGTVIAPGVIDLSPRDLAALTRARAIEPTRDDPTPGYEGEAGKAAAAEKAAAEKAEADKLAAAQAEADKAAADKAAAEKAAAKPAEEKPKRGTKPAAA